MSDDLVSALARAQANFPPISKNHTNPHFKSRYADLSDVLAAVRPVLAAEGIAVLQPLRITIDGSLLLVTVLAGYGETIESSIPLYAEGMTPQQLGSTLSYYRRYALSSMLAVAAEDDDDGNAAQTAPAPEMRSGKGSAPSDKSAQYMGRLRHELVPQEGVWQRFATAVLGEAPPELLSGPQTSKLIDALLAVKTKGEWPENLWPEDTEPF